MHTGGRQTEEWISGGVSKTSLIFLLLVTQHHHWPQQQICSCRQSEFGPPSVGARHNFQTSLERFELRRDLGMKMISAMGPLEDPLPKTDNLPRVLCTRSSPRNWVKMQGLPALFDALTERCIVFFSLNQRRASALKPSPDSTFSIPIYCHCFRWPPLCFCSLAGQIAQRHLLQSTAPCSLEERTRTLNQETE